MEEQSSCIENYIKEFTKSKSRVFILICSIISIICSVLFMTENNLSALTSIYAFLLLCSGAANAVYSADINEKNKFSSDIIVGGAALFLTGVLLRIIQVALVFSVKYFVSYCLFGAALILFIVKLGKNTIKGKFAAVLSALTALSCVAEFFCLSTYGVMRGIYKISEAALFACCIGVLMLNRGRFREFSERAGNYKTQIPALKICLGIYALFIAVFAAAGTLKNADRIHKERAAVQKIETVRKQPEKEKIEKTEKIEKVTPADSEVAEQSSAELPREQSAQSVSIGEKVETGLIEFTLNKVELSYRVEPDNPPSYYTYYAASEGQVYIYVNASVKNVSQQDIDCDEIYSVTADYNNGYKYTGFNVITDSDGDFNYANINTVTPLQTMGVHCLIECPEEVEKSDNPLTLTFKLRGGKELLYTVR